MKIKEVYGVNISLLFYKFKKEIAELRQIGVTNEEIESDLYTTSILCRNNYVDKYNVSFWKYLYISISKNLNKKIHDILEVRANEVSMPSNFDYCVEPIKKDGVIDAVSNVPTNIVDSLINYCNGTISETYFLEYCNSCNYDPSQIIQSVHQSLDDFDQN